ncbi:MAG: DUF4173 domain-containing protein [Chloroflexota bacterium]
MFKHPQRLWLISLVTAWLFDFLFWEKSPGISFALYIAIVLAGGFILARQEGVRPARASLWLLLPLGLLSILTFVRAEPFTRFLDHLLALAFLAMFAYTFLGGRWREYKLSDYIVNLFRLGINLLVLPIKLIRMDRQQPPSEERTNTRKKAYGLLRGIVLAIPILALFASLLAAADPVFSRGLNDFLEIFHIENLPEYLFRGTYILILTYFLSGALLHALTASHEECLTSQDKPWIPPFLGALETTVVLCSVDVLFAIFVGVQFRYFFGGERNISFEGFTYSEYARRGFGELVAVAFLSLLFLLAFSAITHRETRTQRRTFSGLAIALVSLVCVILVSAFQRLSLYEEAYGFTRLRTYSHVFMIWLGLLLITVVVLELRQRMHAFALAALVATLGFSLSLNVLNVDGFITHQNISRTQRGEELDVTYLLQLSDDAVPVLLKYYTDSRLSPDLHEQLSVALACYATPRDSDTPTPWQSFHLSHVRAQRLLQPYQEDLASLLTRKYGSWWVKTQREEISCDVFD